MVPRYQRVMQDLHANDRKCKIVRVVCAGEQENMDLRYFGAKKEQPCTEITRSEWIWVIFYLS